MTGLPNVSSRIPSFAEPFGPSAGPPALEVTRPWAAAAPTVDSLVETSHGPISVRESSGRKLPVLLLHDLSSCKEAFDGLLAGPLGQQYRFVAMDMPGHGASANADDSSRTYSLQGYADAALEVLENLGIDEAAVLGWSIGGHVAIEMASMFDGLVGLVIAAAPLCDGATAARLASPALLQLAGREALAGDEIDHLASAMLGGIADDRLRNAVERTDGRARTGVISSLPAYLADEWQRLDAWRVPLAVIAGAADPFIDTDFLRRLSFPKPSSRQCHLFPRVGHAPFLEAPAVFNHLLARFLRRLEAWERYRATHPVVSWSA